MLHVLESHSLRAVVAQLQSVCAFISTQRQILRVRVTNASDPFDHVTMFGIDPNVVVLNGYC